MAPLGTGTSTLTYTYDAAGRRTQMQVTGQTAVTYGYDDAHRMTGITQGTNVVGFTYDAASRRTLATLPNGVTIDYAYDNANQLTGLTYKRNGVTLGNLTYGYDAAGRRTSMGGSYARVNLPPALTSATYDAANKLTNWAGTAQTYDLNGNLTGDGTRTYTWDTRDRLTATSGGGQTSSYVYDAFGRRISRTISGSQTAYVHDGHNPVHTGTGSTITGTLLNGGGLDERYGRTMGSANTALLTDALGSLLHIVDAAGATTATYTYEPYGAVTHSGTDSTGFQYTGREVDVGGLMYYRARYYNPRTARFLSEDPIGLAGGVNLYGYVGGSPTNAVDPSGQVVVIYGRTPGEFERIRKAYDAVRATKRGGELCRYLEGKPEKYYVGPGKGEFNPTTRDISVPFPMGPRTPTTHGYIPATPERVLAHELGHAATGNSDFGPYNNWQMNENPIMKELGQPERLYY